MKRRVFFCPRCNSKLYKDQCEARRLYGTPGCTDKCEFIPKNKLTLIPKKEK